MADRDVYPVNQKFLNVKYHIESLNLGSNLDQDYIKLFEDSKEKKKHLRERFQESLGYTLAYIYQYDRDKLILIQEEIYKKESNSKFKFRLLNKGFSQIMPSVDEGVNSIKGSENYNRKHAY